MKKVKICLFPVSLAQIFSETLMLGMEIRVKVSDYVNDRIVGLRKGDPKEIDYQNIACLRTNAMKYLPNLFEKGQVNSFCYFIHINLTHRTHSSNLKTTYRFP